MKRIIWSIRWKEVLFGSKTWTMIKADIRKTGGFSDVDEAKDEDN